MMAVRFIRTFRDLNADIAANIPVVDSTQSLLDLALSTTPDNASLNMDSLLDTLKRQTQYGVLYIFDEHNELYRKPDKGNSPLHDFPRFLNRFTRWTGATGGVSIFVHNRSELTRFESIYSWFLQVLITSLVLVLSLLPLYRSERSQSILAQLILDLRIICHKEKHIV